MLGSEFHKVAEPNAINTQPMTPRMKGVGFILELESSTDKHTLFHESWICSPNFCSHIHLGGHRFGVGARFELPFVGYELWVVWWMHAF